MSSAPTINAIPTEYAGTKFRSRLEARWAMLFDLMGGEWVYEPEGYEWDGIRYLPDFWLPKANSFFEVKPDADGVFPKQMALAASTGKNVIVGVGDVQNRQVILVVPSEIHRGFVVERLYRYIDWCPTCRLLYWRQHGEAAKFCRDCGTNTDLTELARRAQNESLWNTPVIAPTTSLRDRLRSEIPRGSELVVTTKDDEARITAAKNIFDAEEVT